MQITPSADIALIYRDLPITYQQLCVRSQALSLQLVIRPGERVVIFCENRPEWIYCLFAVWQAGGIAVPVDALSRQEELAYIVKDSAPTLVLTSSYCRAVAKQALFGQFLPSRTRLLCVDDLNLEDSNSVLRRSDAGLTFGNPVNNTALVLYTSGTTGNPKGVMLSFANLFSNVDGIRETQIVSHTDRVLSILPFHHSYPLMVTIIVPLCLGASIVMLERISGEDIMRAMTLHKVTIFVCVPRVINLLHQKIMQKIHSSPAATALFNLCKTVKKKQVGRLVFKKVHALFGAQFRFFVSGGAKLDETIAEDIEALGFDVLEGYGLTETSPIVTFNRGSIKRIGTVGLPLKNVDICLMGEEVCVRGANVMQGYLGLPEKTAEVVRDGWFHTGDAGKIDSEGFLRITGRIKEMIVLASGKNINPEDIEAQLVSQATWVKEVAVLERDGRLFALIRPDFDALKAANVVNISNEVKWKVVEAYNLSCREYAKITGFKVVQTELPRTRLGKLRRFMLQTKALERDEAVSANDPDDPIWHVLKNFLANLTTKPFSFDSHLEIDLGFDSLDKVELLVFIEKTFRIKITEEQLAGLMEIKRLVKYLRQAPSEGQSEMQQGSTFENTQAKIGEGLFEALKHDVATGIASSSFLLLLLKYVLLLVFKLFFRLRVKGVEQLPVSPMLICPNHQSYMDGFLILASLPAHVLKDTCFVATEDFFRSKLRKAIAYHVHVIPLDAHKGIMDVMKQCASLLRNGKNVVIFPEGARTRDGRLMQFHETFAILACHARASVAPVAISGAFEAYPAGQRFPKPAKVTVQFLKQVNPIGKSPQELTTIVKERIQSLLDL